MQLGKGNMKIILQNCQQQMHGIRRHLRNRHMEHCYGGVKILAEISVPIGDYFHLSRNRNISITERRKNAAVHPACLYKKGSWQFCALQHLFYRFIAANPVSRS